MRLERLKRFERVDIYPVTCERLSCGRSDIDVLRGVIAGGTKIIQLREKELSKRELYKLALEFRAITSESDVLLIINDHVDIALACGADGVHLGQSDLPVRVAREIAPDLIIGLSSHDETEALAAQIAGADYVNIGPVFATKTKEGTSVFLGPEKIAEISRHLNIPFTVMGGIKLANIESVISAGATKIAVVSAISMADDIPGATRALINKISKSP